ncbi:hypothetical protein [Chitinophaga dinghuensis]|uniref:hypothetical protein n=1 Tax=Chitinophaga dinghuensis TaxID=1539050 RepID=UPI000DB96927|nr:hypothetical protein [Chitinophaga dinghuensis]
MKTKLLLLFSACILLMSVCTYGSLFEWSSDLQHHILKAILLLLAGLMFTTGAVVSYARINRL